MAISRKVGQKAFSPVSPEEIEELRERLREAEETLLAIRTGEVDALIVDGQDGSQVFTLRGADRPYRLLVEEMSQGAATLLPDGTLLYCNLRLAEMLHIPLQKLIGSSLCGFVSESDRAAFEHLLERTVSNEGNKGQEGPQSRREVQNVEIRFVVAQGEGEEAGGEGEPAAIPVYLSASMLQRDEGRAVCLVITDLTEQKLNEAAAEAGRRKLAEEQLKANKLESIGILAGGLAHDINNSLTAMLGNIAMAGRSAGDREVVERRLAQAEAACLQAREVTQQLLTFARGGSPVKKTVSIGPLLREWTSFAMAGSNVVCEYLIAGDLAPVDIDEGQISRMLSNLLINAKQSMPHGGVVTLRAENIYLGPDQTHAEGVPLEPGHYVRISVQDRGTGIPERHLSKIFDPYFTTKQTGSGLGLASVYSIVKNHGGHITVESELGIGCTFSVLLPASGVEAALPGSPNRSMARTVLRVLVMDDHESIREIVGDMLTELEGHEVDHAEHGEEAVEMYRRSLEQGEPFDIVIMDLTIAGGAGGKEAVRDLLKVDPEAKVIVFSGYSSDPIMANYKDYGFSGVLRKPFGAEELLEEVHRVSGSTSQAN
ncbi:MAG: ATP-binding protein [Chloroflexota bacterium]